METQRIIITQNNFFQRPWRGIFQPLSRGSIYPNTILKATEPERKESLVVIK